MSNVTVNTRKQGEKGTRIYRLDAEPSEKFHSNLVNYSRNGNIKPVKCEQEYLEIFIKLIFNRVLKWVFFEVRIELLFDLKIYFKDFQRKEFV